MAFVKEVSVVAPRSAVAQTLSVVDTGVLYTPVATIALLAHYVTITVRTVSAALYMRAGQGIVAGACNNDGTDLELLAGKCYRVQVSPGDNISFKTSAAGTATVQVCPET